MKVGSLFSGIGGFDLGLERAGMQVVWQSEIEPYCCEVLKKWWPDVPNLGDIFKIKNPPAVDLICGGVPCQPASCAGKRRGTEDDRWLWPDTLRIIHEVKPTWCILENVCGILSLEGGLVFENLLLALEAEGYEVQSFIIPACALNAPHRRNRIWIVGHANTIRCSRLSRKKSEIQDENTHLHRSNGIVTHTKHDRCHGAKVCVSRRGSQQTLIDSAGTDRHASDSKVSKRKLPGGTRPGREGFTDYSWQESWFEVATNLLRVDDGLPTWIHRHRVKRLKALGNTIIPQIAEEIGRMIMKIERKR